MTNKIAVIHLSGCAPDGVDTVDDFLLIRSPVAEGDEVQGVKRFKNETCHITKIKDDVIYATGMFESGEIATCPIGEMLDWNTVRVFPVIAQAFMRSNECVGVYGKQSKVIKMAVNSILRTLQWSSALNSPTDWRPANDIEKHLREIVLSGQKLE